ncbi:aldehyde dehydrogenase family protein [Modestobacter lapidis]|nr:aldehyde dehydrogenase family protein [Modestobacter lapidis]
MQTSLSTATEKPAVRRAQAPGPLLEEGELPPGQHFIDGAFHPHLSGSLMDVIDPSCARRILQAAEGTVEDTDLAVAAAVAAAPAWGDLRPKVRSELLHRVADIPPAGVVNVVTGYGPVEREA